MATEIPENKSVWREKVRPLRKVEVITGPDKWHEDRVLVRSISVANKRAQAYPSWVLLSTFHQRFEPVPEDKPKGPEIGTYVWLRAFGTTLRGWMVEVGKDGYATMLSEYGEEVEGVLREFHPYAQQKPMPEGHTAVWDERIRV